MNKFARACSWIGLLLVAPLSGAERISPWADFIEPNFPFFSSVVDVRETASQWPTNNLTPRGLILNLGNDCWVCFDTDLLRVAALWSGKCLTPVSMSQGSYHVAGRKAPPGQEELPRIAGQLWLVNGLYPGWQTGNQMSLVDPRDPGPDPNEPGRGPLPGAAGQFKAVRFVGNGVVLEYEVAGHTITDQFESKRVAGSTVVQRLVRLSSVKEPLFLVLGHGLASEPPMLRVRALRKNDTPVPETILEPPGLHAVRITPTPSPTELRVTFSLEATASAWESSLGEVIPRRWPEILTTSVLPSKSSDAYVVDNIGLPTANPWKRNVRLADLAFFDDGRAVAVSYDGDLWMIEGLEGTAVRWKRFSSGFHEPLGVVVREGQIYVHDRNGIWRVVDTDQNGEADLHQLFCNAFSQTAETREFATGIKLAPDGSFIIAKGGQESSTRGKNNGSVLRIAPDGRSSELLGWGLRMPFIGVHPKTGLVTASDQQGNYVPTTPIHIMEGRKFYGFLTPLVPKEDYPAPIADPLVWIPHAVNASGVDQVWLTGARLGPLNDALIHLGYYRPELFVVRLHERASRPQAAVVSLTRDFSFSPLSAAVNPRDGQLYVIGFQIWGTEAPQISGLARVRYTGAPNPIPREVVAMNKGVLLRFDVELDEVAACNPANYAAERWNYRRTPQYGSPHFRLDGAKGQETMVPASAYLSRDKKSVFVGLADMKPVMQMRLAWGLQTQAGADLTQNCYFTPYEMVTFQPTLEGFDAFEVDLTPRVQTKAASSPITVEEGQRLSGLMGCVACHSTDGSTVGKVGPSWKGLFGSRRSFAKGGEAMVDEKYLRESIKEPSAKVVKGYDTTDVGMPSYEGVLTEAQIEALVVYLTTLR